LKMKKISCFDLILTIIVALYNLGLMFFSLIWIFTNQFKSVKDNLQPLQNFEINENVTFSLFLAGVLGGSFYCLRALYERLGQNFTPVIDEHKTDVDTFNIKVWFFWYLYRPIQGAVLALIILTLINCNLFSQSELDAESMKSYYTLVSVGFLCGFGSHEVMHKIQEIIKVTFAKSIKTGSSSEQKVKENNE
jgi:hypothetical protein